jgi:hypothetical protein
MRFNIHFQTSYNPNSYHYQRLKLKCTQNYSIFKLTAITTADRLPKISQHAANVCHFRALSKSGYKQNPDCQVLILPEAMDDCGHCNELFGSHRNSLIVLKPEVHEVTPLKFLHINSLIL